MREAELQFRDLWSALIRRWYLLLVVIALAVGSALGVAKAVGPTYQTQAAVLILPPGTSGTGSSQTVGNPYLSLAGVSQVRDVVIRTMMSKTFLLDLCSTTGGAGYEKMTAQLCRQSPAGITFEATPDFTSGAPMILVTVDSESPETGGLALKAVTDRVPDILTELQADLSLRPKALISSTLVVMDVQPDVVQKQQIRAGLLAGAGSFGLGLLAIALVDSTLQRRRPVSEEEALADEIDAEEVPIEEESPDWGWTDGAAEPTADGAHQDDPDVVAHDRADQPVGSAKASSTR